MPEINSHQASVSKRMTLLSKRKRVIREQRMKSYNNLFEKFISDENIALAIHTASKKRKSRRDVRKAMEDLGTFKNEVKEYALNFKNMTHTMKVIYDGVERKNRGIVEPYFKELVVMTMLCQIIEPIFYPGMYECTYASLPSRGSEKGRKDIERFIRKGKNLKYFYKADIRKFFYNIDHETLKNVFSKKIRDKRLLAVINELIDTGYFVKDETGSRRWIQPDKGVPLGYPTSQWFANIYLTRFDHWVKETLLAPAYFRYQDDIVIFSSSKRKLMTWHSQIKNYLRENLLLELKEDWRISRFDYVDRKGRVHGSDVDYMGFRFFRNRTTIRKRILRKAFRAARRISEKTRFTIYDCRQMTSFNGWFRRTDTKRFFHKHIAPRVHMKAMWKFISKYDRRNSICSQNQNVSA